jgi:hypothetical protein
MAVAIALVLVPVAPAGLPVLAASAAVLLGLRTPARRGGPSRSGPVDGEPS